MPGRSSSRKSEKIDIGVLLDLFWFPGWNFAIKGPQSRHNQRFCEAFRARRGGGSHCGSVGWEVLIVGPWWEVLIGGSIVGRALIFSDL